MSCGTQLIVLHFHDPQTDVEGGSPGCRHVCIPHVEKCISVTSARQCSRTTRTELGQSERQTGFLGSPNCPTLTILVCFPCNAASTLEKCACILYLTLFILVRSTLYGWY